MNTHSFRADALLLIAAVLWGAAFVAQRSAMQHMGPHLFDGLRFALGTLALAAFISIRRALRRGPARTVSTSSGARHFRAHFLGGIVAGLILFAGAALQQMGIVDTTAGKAGFITGLYVPLVPIFALLLGRRTSMATWIGVALAVAGLYLLTVGAGSFTIGRGDALVIACAVVWAVHVLVVAHLAPRLDPLLLGLAQFATVAVASLALAAFTERLADADLRAAVLPIAYAGLISVGIAYTLQLVGQREAPPAHAALLLSLESVFAALTGWLLLREAFSACELAGAALMLCAMFISQLPRLAIAPPRTVAADQMCSDETSPAFSGSQTPPG